MSKRIADPPKNQWQHLLTPLTHNEKSIYTLFHDNNNFSFKWEMYIQPYLNGLRPDLVFLNPYAGIAVFEIRDWDLRTLQDSIRDNRTIRNPINQLKFCEKEIFESYCPRLDDRYGHAVITAGLIFPQIPQAEIDRLLDPLRDNRMVQYREQYPFSGSEQVIHGNIDAIFPEHNTWGIHRESRYISEDTAKDLRGWLKEPAFSNGQRQQLLLNPRQRIIATNPPPSRYRKVKGPAGSGKSQALAARAAELAMKNKRVLVCTYNITLMNYLKDLVARHADEIATQENKHLQVARLQIEFRHFHGWCKQICLLTGYEASYNQLWNQKESEDIVLKQRMAELVMKIYSDPSVKNLLPTYDAILVDEGQDYTLLWWQTLRQAAEWDGQPAEMLLSADKTQNIYGTDVTWLDEPMSDTWLSSTWFELEGSYRLPSEIIPILKSFSDLFFVPSNKDVDIPKDSQIEIDFNSRIELRWVQVSSGNSIADICFEEARQQMIRLRSDTAIPDIIFLTQRNEIGMAFVKKCKKEKVQVDYTFGQDEVSRRKKLAFSLGLGDGTLQATTLHSFKDGTGKGINDYPRVKATTLHSFKGWEGRHLILHVSRIATPEDQALFYTALSRLQGHPNGSMLTVVSSCPELRDFGLRNFPNFVDVANEPRQL